MTPDVGIEEPFQVAAGTAVPRPLVDAGADSDAVFPQSVASGGPTASGVILWTRIAPDAVSPGTEPVVEVATDDAMSDVVLRRTVPLPENHDTTIRVDLDGHLEPDRHYHYRFVYDGVASPTGRCRTLPASDASPEELTLGIVSCQHYQNGHFGAFARLAEEDVDFVLHLGDYIYESGDQTTFRAPGARSYEGRSIDLPSGKDIAWTLADFRTLYRTYRSDPHLQRAHERHTFVRGWDDHAIANNRYWDYETDAPVAPDHPRGHDPAFVRQLTADGVRAWWEYSPARVSYDPDAEHLHDALRLYRQVEFGDLVTLVLTDERLYRSTPPYVHNSLPEWLPASPVPDPADRTMLGDEQLAWFEDAVRSAEARWTTWANEVLSMQFRVGREPLALVPNADAWEGYPTEREVVLDALADAGDVVTLTGDMHSTMIGTQVTADGEPVGVELMTPSVTSVNVGEALSLDEGLRRRVGKPLLSGLLELSNPHVDVFDSHHWGYGVASFTREDCTFTVHAVDKTHDGPDAETETIARARVPAGTDEPTVDVLEEP